MGDAILWTAVSAVAACAAALFAGWTAHSTRQMAESSRDAAKASQAAAERMQQAMEVSALVELAQAFGSREMTEAYHLLDSVRDEVKKNLPLEMTAGRKLPGDGLAKVDAARRRISHHHQLIHNLIKIGRGSISDQLVKALVSRDQALFYREVIEPMECKKNADYDRESFEYFGGLYGIPRSVQPMARPGNG